MIKQELLKYSIFSVPTDTQPAAYGKEWLKKVLGYTKSSHTVEDYEMKIRNGSGYKVFFVLKEGN